MLRQKLNDAGMGHIKVDSAGTHAYHAGERADRRAIIAAKERGYDISMIISRPLKMNDFMDFNLIVAMDSGHMAMLERLKPKVSRAELKMHSDFVSNPAWFDVPDPYYGGEEHFKKTFDMIEEGVNALFLKLTTGKDG
jgi:protein-tyrosine phosphatase